MQRLSQLFVDVDRNYSDMLWGDVNSYQTHWALYEPQTVAERPFLRGRAACK